MQIVDIFPNFFNNSTSNILVEDIRKDNKLDVEDDVKERFDDP